MRSTDERIAAVQARSLGIRRTNRHRRNIALSGFATAACLAVIVAVALYLPSAAGTMAQPGSGTSGVYGSVLASGGFIGFVIIGLLAFVLGVAVTLLCVKLKDRERDEMDLPSAMKTDDNGGAAK